MGSGNECLFKRSWSHDQDGRMPIHDKTLKESSSLEPKTLKLGMQHRVLEYYQVCSNDDTWLTLICFMLMLLYGGKR